MTTHRVEEFARQFPENGLKLLLWQPLNVRDLLRIARYRLTNRIDFDRLQPDPTSYVQRDYRHVAQQNLRNGPRAAHTASGH
jgi:hypothetical protein